MKTIKLDVVYAGHFFREADSGWSIICSNFCRQNGLVGSGAEKPLRGDKAKLWVVPNKDGYIQLFVRHTMLNHLNVSWDYSDKASKIRKDMYNLLQRLLLKAGVKDGDRVDLYMELL